jgi:hypothetical protein
MKIKQFLGEFLCCKMIKQLVKKIEYVVLPVNQRVAGSSPAGGAE